MENSTQEKENPTTGIVELKKQINVAFAQMVLNQVEDLKDYEISSIDAHTLAQVRENVLTIREKF